MNIVITNVVRCSGGNHYTFSFKVDGGAVRKRTFTKDELTELLSDVSAQEAIAVLLRNYILSNPDQTPAQLKAGLQALPGGWNI